MADIHIKGTIISNTEQWIYEYFDMEFTSPKVVDTAIQNAKGEDLNIYINSPGGSVFDGSEIYTTLKSYKGNVTVYIIGMAASIASVIAMAGKRIFMSPTGSFMIHNVSVSNVFGDYRTMLHMAEVLKTTNISIVNAYRIKTGLTQDRLLTLMNKETWFSPQEALSLGFIDKIMFDDTSDISKSQAHLELLKLKEIRE